MGCCCEFCCFKQKAAYEMRIRDWSSDVCSSDLLVDRIGADQSFLGLRPIGCAVGQFLLADDDEDIIVGFILVRRCRRIDPVAAGAASEQEDLEAARDLPAPGRIFGGWAELVQADRDVVTKLPMLHGWLMIDHGSPPPNI